MKFKIQKLLEKIPTPTIINFASLQIWLTFGDIYYSLFVVILSQKGTISIIIKILH
jgi:hypothetical protein